MKKILLATIVLAVLHGQANATEENKNWQVSSELGLILTSGNTKTNTFKGAITAQHTLESWVNEYKLDGLYKEDEVSLEDGSKSTQRTNEKYSASAKGSYNITEKHSHLFVYGSHVSDYFGAYRNETVASLGYGSRFYENSAMTLDAEVGPGYKYFRYSDTSSEKDSNGNSLAGDTDGEVIALGMVNFKWQISEGARFTQLVQVEYGGTNTKTKSETALLTKINGSMQMKVGFNVTHNSDVADDKENTDTETVLTLVYNF
ncbi:DUF481 domain-containing protein [Pseudoalteromonas tunicata]|uniref:DUF481 domain-containing protein n=1 Tax=Pseudoalteromonas tunicata TaxID=314281 RepID=UPI00273F23BF|nr:DUF481 domain-containing protein [Pseudoalteromonas tunicata]MDP5213561.1 DUF481 domain-containing protein [Pseudoalteromonas tunicata]